VRRWDTWEQQTACHSYLLPVASISGPSLLGELEGNSDGDEVAGGILGPDTEGDIVKIVGAPVGYLGATNYYQVRMLVISVTIKK
jgi:hypothetical protein